MKILVSVDKDLILPFCFKVFLRLTKEDPVGVCSVTVTMPLWRYLGRSKLKVVY